MTQLLFGNQDQTILSAPIDSSQTTITVASGTAASFPSPGVNQGLKLTIVSATNQLLNEIVLATNITGDVITVIRAQEDTIARSWPIGSFVINLMTAGTGSAFVQGYELENGYYSAEFINVAAETGQITNLPVNPTDIANKQYVDSVSNGQYKEECQVATTVSIALSGLQTIDGYATVAGDRVIVKNQISAPQNGIYVASAGVWSRSADMSVWSQVPGAYCFVQNGTLYARTSWVIIAPEMGVINVDPITWYQVSGSGTYTAGTGLALTGSQFSISNTAVTAGTYGAASSVGSYDVNAQGQLIGSSDILISIGADQINSPIPNSGLEHSTISGVSLGSNLFSLAAGTGLSGTSYNGSAASSFSIANTGVTAASYGASNNTLISTVNAQGQLTALSAVAIAIANTQVSGLGTMSTQNSSSVSIGGGSITGVTLDNSAIGLTTRSSGAFTTIAANGDVTLSNYTGYLKANGASVVSASTTVPTSDLSGTVLNSQLANSSITINGNSVSLGGSTTVTSVTPNSLTFGTGLNSGSFNGSSAVTVSLANVGTVGTFGSANQVPVYTTNAQGQISLSTNTNIDGISLTTGQISTTPTSDNDIANKLYVDTVAQGLNAKASVYVATTANITLSGEQTIDGVLTSASRVLVKNQTTSSQNGIYVSAAGAWSRSADANTWNELVAAYVFIDTGSTLASTGWVCQAQPGGTLGVTAVTWVQFSGAGTYTAGTGLTLAGSQFSITNTAVTAGTYGTASSVSSTTYNAQGQATSASNVLISIASSQINTAIPNSGLANSTISGVSLGSNLFALTLGSGLTGSSYNGSSAITAAIDSSIVATLTGFQTLTNKTISGASNTLSNIGNSSLTNSSVTINGTSVSLGSSATVTAEAGTLTGTTLASNVVSSSLTSVGAISIGTWRGSVVDVQFGGSGATSQTAYAVLCGGATSTGSFQSVSGVGTSGQVLTSTGASSLPTWQDAAAVSAGSLTGTTLASNVVNSSLVTFGSSPTLASPTLNGTISTPGLTASRVVVTNASSQLTTVNYTTATTASTIAQRNSAGALLSSTFGSGLTNNAPVGTTTYTLTAASTGTQYVSTAQAVTFKLPDATTLPASISIEYTFYWITGSICTVQNSAGTTVMSSSGGPGISKIMLLDNSTAAGVWSVLGYITPNTPVWNSFGGFGSTPSAAGASVSSRTVTLQPANGSFPGGVSTAAQNFAGAKTFNNGLISGLAGTATGTVGLSGTTSGTVTIQPQSVAGTYNFNLPTTAGTAGDVLTSQAGGSTAMTWTGQSSLAAGTAANLFNTVAATVTDTTGRITYPAQPSFSAYLSATKSNVTGDGTSYTIIFDTTTKNVGSYYNAATGVFTAPITGTYAFNAYVYISNANIAHTVYTLTFVAGGNSYRCYTINPSPILYSNTTMSLSGYVIVPLTSGQTCSVVLTMSGSTKTVSVNNVGDISGTAFSGFLLG